MTDPLLPVDVSRDGHRIDGLLHVTALFTAILLLVALGWIAIVLWRHGRRHQAEHDHGSSRRAIAWALGVSLAVFAIVDGNLFVTSTLDANRVFWNVARAAATPGALRLQVTARQWSWDVRYPACDAARCDGDVYALNELVIPVGVPVVVELTSADVIHSFYLPNFRIKLNAVPGRVNRVWFQAERAGSYELACAQHCGVSHYKMKGRVIALAPDEFGAWRRQAQALAAREHVEGRWGWPW